jgi:hypothetical protein
MKINKNLDKNIYLKISLLKTQIISNSYKFNISDIF